MKKKLITGVLALVCAVSCAVAFTACGSSDPKKMKSDTVTAEEWKEAFKEDNFKNVKIESSIMHEGDYDMDDGTKEDAKVTLKYTVIVADDIQYYKTETTVEKGPQELKDLAAKQNFEGYSSKSNGKYTTYYKNKDGKWRQCPGENGVADEVIKEYLAYGKLYDKFEYTEGWAKGYWGNVDMLEHPELVKKVLKFKDGKLAAIYYENESTNGNDAESTTLVYGGQSLTLPTPEASSYAGTWKTYQLVMGGNTYNVGDTVEEMGDMPLAADFVTVEIKNDGTATSKNPEGTATGTWMETDDGILFISEQMGHVSIEFDGTYLKVPVYSGYEMTVVLKKA